MEPSQWAEHNPLLRKHRNNILRYLLKKDEEEMAKLEEQLTRIKNPLITAEQINALVYANNRTDPVGIEELSREFKINSNSVYAALNFYDRWASAYAKWTDEDLKHIFIAVEPFVYIKDKKLAREYLEIMENSC